MSDKTDLLDLILSGQRLQEVVSTRRGEFVINFPLPSDQREIELEVADMLGGRPVASFTGDALANFRAYATLKKVIAKAPKWWSKLKSPEECPDVDLTAELYRRYLRFHQTTQKALADGESRSEAGVVQPGANP